MTIADLIRELQQENPNKPVVFQYLTSDRENFKEISEYLAKSSGFGQETADLFVSWVNYAAAELAEEEL